MVAQRDRVDVRTWSERCTVQAALEAHARFRRCVGKRRVPLVRTRRRLLGERRVRRARVDRECEQAGGRAGVACAVDRGRRHRVSPLGQRRRRRAAPLTGGIRGRRTELGGAFSNGDLTVGLRGARDRRGRCRELGPRSGDEDDGRRRRRRVDVDGHRSRRLRRAQHGRRDDRGVGSRRRSGQVA